MTTFRLGLIQLAVGANKAANVQRACDKVREAAANGAKVISLPECFNCPYGTKYFPGDHFECYILPTEFDFQNHVPGCT